MEVCVSRSVDFADNAEFVACKIDLPEYGTAYISAVDFAMAVCWKDVASFKIFEYHAMTVVRSLVSTDLRGDRF